MPRSSRILSVASLALAGLALPQLGVPQEAPKRDLSKGNTLYVVPYAHLDTQWRWAYPQVIREYIANTLNDNFALIDQFPHYVFNFSGSRRYEMMKEYYPAEYERLKGYIRDGRWFPCGSSVDEGDANVPSGESLIRHILYGNHYFRREFGVASHEFMLPDCFGFPYALPSILNHCGIQGFSTQKLTWGSAVGIPFKVGRWYGPDGKMVVAALDPGAYSGDVSEDLSQNTSWLARIQNTGKQSGAYVDYHYYGTGDRGGAPRAGSVEWIEKSIAGTGPISVVSTRADAMFTSLTPDQISKLPSYQGELLLTQHSAGSITSEAYMKRWNRKSELLADAAERASVAAMWLGGSPYPSDRLYRAWDLVLGSQMHDMLPGTSIPKAYEFCWNDYLLAQNTFAHVETDAVSAVTSAMDTRGKGRSLVVYNPVSIDRDDVVEATVYGFGKNPILVFGPDGRPITAQVLNRNGDAARILFRAKVPANGFATFDVRKSPSQSTTDLRVTQNSLENARFRVTVNAAGDISSIYDKANKREVLKAPIQFAFQYHNPSAFPAWNMDWQDAKLPPRAFVTGAPKISVVEDGPVRCALQIERTSEGSTFRQTVRLASGAAGDRIEVLNKIDWGTRESALKASFPLAAGNPKATYELQLGTVERGNNNDKKYEVPQHQWFDLTSTDGKYGVGVLNDCKFGSDKPDDNTVRLTMLYTPGVRGGFEDQATQDFGRHDITYALAPHAGDWRQGNVTWSARRLNQPLRAFNVSQHPGKLGKSFSLIRSSSKQVEISALKKAEDSNEIIVRLRELEGRPANGVRISTLSGIASARELNGQEMSLGPATVSGGVLVANVPAYSLKTFAIRLAPSTAKATATVSKPLALPYNLDAVSSDKNRADGAFNAAGETYAAEQFPSSLNVDGVQFKLGPTQDGAKNALVAQGQKIALPKGTTKVSILAASSGGDTESNFLVNRNGDPIIDPSARFQDPQLLSQMAPDQKLTIQSWSGYVGQWDNRLWSDDEGPNYQHYGEWAGLEPGYVKGAEVATYASHRHSAKAGNEFYQYSYLYKYDLPVSGASSITLPKDARIKIFAVTAVTGDHEAAYPATPLYDTLADHHSAVSGDIQPSAFDPLDNASSAKLPMISPAAGAGNDATLVTMRPPLYWHSGSLHYTVDGSTPTASSPLYTGPIWVTDPVKVQVAEIDAKGNRGPVAVANVNVHDVTPPRAIEVSSPKALGLVQVKFSEQVDRTSAENPANYSVESAKVTAAHLEPDGRTVELTLDGPLATGQTQNLAIRGVKDVSRSGNTIVNTTAPIVEQVAVFTSPTLEPGVAKSFPTPSLPSKSTDHWTINLLCRTDTMPEPRTMIAGFGRSIDGRTGAGRYFTVFSRGLNFWVTSEDVETSVPLDLGKWQMLTATYDGRTVRFYKNAELIGHRDVGLESDQPTARVFPPDAWERKRTFKGEIRDFTIWDQDLSSGAIQRLWESLRAKS